MVDDDTAASPDWLARLLSHYEDDVGGVGGRDVDRRRWRPGNRNRRRQGHLVRPRDRQPPLGSGAAPRCRHPQGGQHEFPARSLAKQFSRQRARRAAESRVGNLSARPSAWLAAHLRRGRRRRPLPRSAIRRWWTGGSLARLPRRDVVQLRIRDDEEPALADARVCASVHVRCRKPLGAGNHPLRRGVARPSGGPSSTAASVRCRDSRACSGDRRRLEGTRSMVTVSLCVCTRDRPADLERCLASVAAGSELPQAVIVSDDGKALGRYEGDRLIAGRTIRIRRWTEKGFVGEPQQLHSLRHHEPLGVHGR